MTPSAARLLGERNSVKLSSERFDANGGYAYSSFHDFLDCYHHVGSAVVKPADLGWLAQNYLRRVAAEGTIYVEFMLSPDHSIENGISYEDQLEAVLEGIEASTSEAGIDARLIVTAVRHKGPDKAVELAKLTASISHPLVVGFGLTGNEHMYEAADFADAFGIAADAGLGLTAHAGEWRNGQSVLDAVSALRLARVGHGISVTESDALLSQFVSTGASVEVCLSSNVELGSVKSYSEHPVRRLIDVGVSVNFATDDPGFFETSPAMELQKASSLVGVQPELLTKSIFNSIEMAFCGENLRANLRSKAGALDLRKT